MNYLIWPIALFIFEYFNIHFPVYYGLRIQIYVYVFFILIALFQLRGEVPRYYFNKKVILFICALLLLQMIAMSLSFYKIDVPKYNKNPISTLFSFVGFIGAIIVHYLVIRLNVKNLNDVNKFLKGGLIAFLISLIICFIQLFYLFFPTVLEPMVNLIGETVEARWGGQKANENEYSFYSLGSYVQTTLRINGLTEEASNLATQFFVIFIPFLIASIKNKYNLFASNKNLIFPLYWGVFLVLILLLMAKTTSGFLFSAIILLVLFNELNKFQKIFALLILLFGLLNIIGSNFNNVYVSDIVNQYLLNKGENSVSNRSAVTLALLITALKNILVGVGFEYQSYFIYKYWPSWAEYNYEYFLWEKSSIFPVLSNILGLFAQYGIVVMVPVFLYIVRRIKQLGVLTNKATMLSVKEAKLIKTMYDSSKYYFVFLLISLFFSFVWYSSLYLLLFFFFMSLTSIVKNVLKNSEENIADEKLG